MQASFGLVPLRLGLVLLAGAACATTACATTKHRDDRDSLTERVGERATEGALESSLDVLSRPESQEQLAAIMGSPPIREAVRGLSASVVAGALDGMVGAPPPQAAAAPGAEVDGADAVGGEPGTREQRLARGGDDFDAAWSAWDDEPRSRSERLLADVGDTLTSGVARAIEEEFGPALAASIERQLGPALAASLERDVLPAMGRGVQSEDVQQAIRQSTASLALGAAIGTERGIQEVNPPGEDQGVLSDVQGTLTTAAIVVIVVGLVLAVALVVLTVMLVRASRRQRQMFEESRRREQLLIELLQQRAESTTEHPIITPGTA